MNRAALLGLGFLTGSAWLWPAAADIAVSRQDCDRLAKYQQPPGVEYQPGVDAHGQPVVPADLGGGVNIQLPQTIIIPIEVLIQDKYHIPANSALWSAKAEMGVVTVQGDQVLYNGQPLTDPETAALADLCRQQLPYK
ncbi:MAG TPA: hypothetical protein VHA35_07755 [Dongiaceae bacterium]|jgi:hypothetical protein|nr:hypothetical protein [Dongiaceae bacterium]